MEEPQSVIAETDELEGEADNDGIHPQTLQQQNPWFISIVVNSVISLLVAIGWYALAFLLVGYILWWYNMPKIKEWKRKQEENKEAADYHKNPDRALARERAIDAARQRMQDQYNTQVQKKAEDKELEEKKRQECKEDLEQGENSRMKTSTNESKLLSGASGTNSSAKPSGKPTLRPEYNPLTGDTSSGSCRWRPSQRGSSGGG